jgi:tetratricopeptide (TPR) repeat protein
MSGSQDIFQQALQNGHSAAWDGDWELAAGYYNQAVEASPQNFLALSSLGLALFELLRYDAALVYYSRAATISPEDPLPYEKIAQISEIQGKSEFVTKAGLQAEALYAKRGETDKVIENLTRVARVDAENMTAHARLAMVYERQGLKAQAVQEYIAIASLMQSQDQVDKAIQSVTHALEILPESGEAQRALTSLQESKPLPKPIRSSGGFSPMKVVASRQEAEEQSGETQDRLDPISEARHLALATLAELVFEQPATLSGTKRDLQAIMVGFPGIAREKRSDPGLAWEHLNQAVDFQTHDQEGKAAEELEKAIEAGLDHAAAYFDLGLLRMEEGRLETSLRNLQHAKKHADYALGARLLTAKALRRMERLDEAALEYLEALKIADSQIVDPDEADELMQLYEPVIEAETKRDDQTHKVKVCDTVDDLLTQVDWMERLKTARRELPVDGDAPPMPLGQIISDTRTSQVVESINAINYLAKAGFYRSAMEEALSALQQAPTYLPLHVQMGELLIQQNHLREATDKFTVVAKSYSARGDLKRAIQMLRRVTRVSPMDLVARNQLIQLLIERGQVEEAIQSYLEMAEVYYNLADLARARQTYQQAFDLAKQSHCEQDVLIHIHYQMADIDLQSLDWREALLHFDQIRQLRPDDQHAREALVELNIRLGKQNEAERELADYIRVLEGSAGMEKVVEGLESLSIEYPDQYFLKKNLAQAYQKIGRRARAVDEYNRLLEAYLQAGEKQEAHQVLETLLSLDPKNENHYREIARQVDEQ